MTSSTAQATTEDRAMRENGQQPLVTAADVDEEPVWIAISPCSSTLNDGSSPHRRHASNVRSADRQLASEAFRVDNVIRRQRITKTKDDERTSGCHRAHALFVWNRAIVEWRVMSAVIDRLLFVIFLVATVLIYVVILVILPTMKSTATVDSPPVTASQSHCLA